MDAHSSAADTSTTLRGATTGGVVEARGIVSIVVAIVVTGLVMLGCSATYSGAVADPSSLSTPETTGVVMTPSDDLQGAGDDADDVETGGEASADDLADVSDSEFDGSIAPDEIAPESAPPGLWPPPVVDWMAFESGLLERWGNYRGLTAAAVVDGQVVWVASRKEADPAMRFRLASLSKVLTSVVIHQLVAEGRLALDQPIGALAASTLGVDVPARRSEALTPAMLLSHRSGFDKYEAVFFKGVQNGDWRDVAARGLREGPGSDPTFAYSNMNYVVLGAVIEAVTGVDYEQAVRTRVLEPLGIDGMRLAGTHDVRLGDALHPSGPTRNYMEMLGPAGAWIGTAADMALVLGSLAPGGNGWRPLSAEMISLMQTPGASGPLPGGYYAYGVMFDNRGAFGHTGSVENSRTMGMVTADGIAWVVLVNGAEPQRASAIGERVSAALDAARR